jgi:type IV secretory pathway TraG/TraD family ATPase VirD4
MTILQSWSQGVEVWGRDGMRKLWSASNIAVYGGGVKEPEFLNELSQMVGDYDKHTTSTSVGRGNRSTSHQVQRERTLDVADLGALPRGRAVVFASGAPATLIETLPWMRSPQADAVRASIAAHDPSSRTAPIDDHAVPVTPDGGTQAWLNAAPKQEGER